MSPVKTIDAGTLKAALEAREAIAIVDMRDEDTFSARHLLMASCLPLSRIEVVAPRLLPRTGMRIVVCDDGGGLAERGARRLVEAGYTDVCVLQGGLRAWIDAGYRVYSGVHVPSKAFAEVVEHHCGTPWKSAEDIEKLRKSGADMVIFDSRSFEEYNNNSIPGAVSVPGAELVYRFDELVKSRDTMVVVNCGGRTRSIIGAQSLINAGIPNPVCSLMNGTMAWHLGGFEMIHGATAQAPVVSAENGKTALERAAAVAAKFGVPTIDKATLARYRAEADRHTLHIIDVRAPSEYDAGHLPGSVNCAGGQLVQETDNWIADWNARIVLVDDTGVRALMTASWLKQMGCDSVCVLKDGLKGVTLETGAPLSSAGGFPLQGPEPVALTPKQAWGELQSGQAVAVDISLSKAFAKSHAPGAWHAVRSRLLHNIGKLPPGKPIILTSEDGVLARFAAAELGAALDRPVSFIAGGNRAWLAAGLATESGKDRMLDDADDVWYAPRERPGDREKHMRDYLEWEIDLVNQVETDKDCRFGAVH